MVSNGNFVRNVSPEKLNKNICTLKQSSFFCASRAHCMLSLSAAPSLSLALFTSFSARFTPLERTHHPIAITKRGHHASSHSLPHPNTQTHCCTISALSHAHIHPNRTACRTQLKLIERITLIDHLFQLIIYANTLTRRAQTYSVFELSENYGISFNRPPNITACTLTIYLLLFYLFIYLFFARFHVGPSTRRAKRGARSERRRRKKTIDAF